MVKESMFCRSRRLLLLPMVSESKFCLRRSRRCFCAILFVTSNVAKIKLAWTPKTKVSPKMRAMMFTTIVRAIEMFRVENGMVLIMMEEALAWVGCAWREKRTKISEPIMKRTVRLANVMWKYMITCEFELLTSMSEAMNGGFPGTQE